MIEKTIDYEKLLDTAMDRIHTMGVGKILNVDNRLGFADIQILNIFKNKKSFNQVAPLKQIPILPLSYSSTFEEGIEYSVNDKVLVAWFSDEGTGALNSVQIIKNIIFKRKFNINECVILRGLKNTTKIPMSESGRYIKNRKTGDLFIMKSSGGIEITSKTGTIINSDLKINGDTEIDGNLKTTGDLEVSGDFEASNIECENVEAQKINVQTGIFKNNIPYDHP